MSNYISYDFPLASPFTKEEMQQRYWKCLYTSSSEKMLHYWVALPQSLKPAEIKPVDFPEVGLVNIGRYITSDDTPYLEVWAAYERCEWEMNASDWLFKKLSIMGEKILHQRIINNPNGSGKFADVLTVKVHASGDEVISRYTIQKDYNPAEGGGNYFLLKASCASRDYAALADDIFFVVVNWDLLNRSNLALAELLTTVNLGAGSSFKVPLSWKAKVISENRMLIEHTIENVNYGAINLYFYPDTVVHSAEEIFDKCADRFHQQDNGITLVANELEPIQNDFNSSLNIDLFTCTGEITSRDDHMRAFYQAYVFNKNNVWAYIELVGRHRNVKDYHFEENKRCLEIIFSTMQISAH